MSEVRTRFAPSPTGSLHVGGARTALFNYLLAKKLGGKFLLRIEDTDRARHSEDAVNVITRDLKWLGIQWDEGFEAGGEYGPYRQSERLEIYTNHIQQLLDEGKAYYAFDAADELAAQREAAQKAGTGFKYQRPEILPTLQDAQEAREKGLPVVVRFLNPGEDITVTDEIFGDVTIPASEQDDFIIQKADGWPTYHLANVVDDALMQINFVLRGQEFLGQTWRHMALRNAFGYPHPKYAHLPLIMDMKGRKLSKRDGDVEVESFKKAGYLPETLVNFLALLGWNPKTGQESFNLGQLVESFDLAGVSKSNAKFDRDKLLAFSTNDFAEATQERLAAGLKDYLEATESPIPTNDNELLAKLVEMNAGARSYADIPRKVGVLFAADDSYDFDPKSVKKVLLKNESQGYAVLEDLAKRLLELEWNAQAIDQFIHDYCQEKELGMGKVAQPIRVAVTGATVSPSIGDTLVLLGKDSTIARIGRCLASRD